MDFPNNDDQEEIQFSEAHASGPPTLESVLKQLREIQARFKEHLKSSAMVSANLTDQFLFLQKLLVGTLVSLIFMCLGVSLFFGKQMLLVRTQLSEQRPAILRNLQEFQSRVDPRVREFAAQLQAFAAAHPDFRPILERHRASLSEYFPAVVPGGVGVSPLNTNLPPEI